MNNGEKLTRITKKMSFVYDLDYKGISYGIVYKILLQFQNVVQRQAITLILEKV